MNVNSGLPLLLPRPRNGLEQNGALDRTQSAASSVNSVNSTNPPENKRTQSDRNATTLRDTLSPSDAQKLRENGVEREKSRAEHLPSTSTFSPEAQRAIGAYQQTLQASQEFDGGVLVGIDTYA